MEREEEAKIAIAGLNGHEFQGSQLNVEVRLKWSVYICLCKVILTA